MKQNRLMLIYSLFNLMLVPMIKLVTAMIVVYVYSSNSPSPSKLVIWILAIAGIIWAMESYYYMFELDKLRARVK